MIRKETVAEEIVKKIRSGDKSCQEFLEALTDKELIGMILRRLYDPGEAFYTKPNTHLAFSVKFPKEEYLMRFYMTAIVAFINTMLDEWQPEVSSELISENDLKFSNTFNLLINDFKKTTTIKNLEEEIERLNNADPKNPEAIFTTTAELYKTKQYYGEDTKLQMRNLKHEYRIHKMKIGKAQKTNKKKDKLFKDIKINEYIPNDEDRRALKEITKLTLGITETKEEATNKIKEQIALFLDTYFSYNPDNHVRCNYKPSYCTELLNKLQSFPEEERKSYCIRFRDEKMRLNDRNLIPPEDTFHRLNRYINANSDKLKQATDDIYPDLKIGRMLDGCICFYDIISGKNPEDLEQKKRKFLNKYDEEFVGRVDWAEFGRWRGLGCSEEEWMKRDVDSRNKFLSNLNTKYESEKKMAIDMMKKRVDSDKKKIGDNETENRVKRKGALEQQGVKHIDDLYNDQFISVDDLPINIDPLSHNEDEVKVINFVPSRTRFSNRVDVNEWKTKMKYKNLYEDNVLQSNYKEL